jgi:YVTN family beta-propeller protein
VAADSRPCALCYNPQGNKIYCANYVGGNVTVIDGASDSVVATVAADSQPSALCYDRQDNMVYCANAGTHEFPDSTVTVIDGATNEVDTTIVVGLEPRALACNPTQGRVYVANYNWSSISVLRDSAGGIQEGVVTRLAGSKPVPTIVRGVLFQPEAPSRKPRAASLLDISGRKVMDLLPGANDVRGLAPGVYFIREARAQAQAQAIRKVIVLH